VQIGPEAGQSKIILEAIQPTISEIRDEIRIVGNKADRHLLYLLGVFAAGFLLLAGALVTGYFRLSDGEDANYKLLTNQIQTSETNLTAQINQVNDGVVRVSTQISDIQSQKKQ
jgi:hypothetical protein